MIFEKKQFDNYCLGRNYQSSLPIHLVTYDMLLSGYDRVFKRSMEQWLKEQQVLDAGCAMGHVMDDLMAHEIQCSGYEPSNYAIANLLPSVQDKVRKGSHDDILPTIRDEEYDVVYANSLQYSLNEDDIKRWTKEIARVCRHSMFFVSVTTQGIHRCVSGPDIWKMQIVRPKAWWDSLFTDSGFAEVHWLGDVMAICLKQPLCDRIKNNKK